MAISLGSISKTRRAAQPPRIVVHGLQGAGKSTFAAGAPSPIFLPFEDGLSGIETDAFPLLRSWDDAVGAIASLLNEEHGYATVVLDSLDWLEPHIQARVAADHKVANIEAIPYGKGYVEATAYWRTLLDGLNALRERRNMAVILIAHTQVRRFESPEMESYDRYEMKLHKAAGALCVEWADVVGLAQAETTIAREKTGMAQRVRGISTGRRVLRTSEAAAYVAKNRYSLPDPLPLDWNALAAAIWPATESAATAADASAAPAA